ncbi:MAG: T9SS type A sorting domain-containing protein [Ignavibacteriales bacterium]|nr:T9SS type A sorting domain-containing protein [Ignavibacteriales bacterium]
MKKLFIAVILLVTGVFAQELEWTPYFATPEDSIVIIYDASKGNGGLVGVFPIYAHTGVITSESTSPSDWRYVKTQWGQNTPATQLTFISGTKWKIAFKIREYYGIPAGETVLQLAFVFRNSAGTLTGKTSDGGDIFLPLSTPGQTAAILQPPVSGIIAQNTNVPVLAIGAPGTQTMKLFINGSEVASVNNDSITYQLTASSMGKTRIKAVAIDGMSGQGADSVYYVVRGNTPVQALPGGVKDGINYTSATSATMVLYAPSKQFVYLIGDMNGWEIDPAQELYKTPDGNRYWLQLNNLTAGKEYRFQYLVDNAIKIGDPYSEKVLDPWNDKYIDSLRYPGLIQYPLGLTSNVVSVMQPGQTPYQWQVTNFQKPAKEKLVVYELLIRDFTSAQTYKSITDTLGYLQRLGINCLELMPVMEFEGNNSWGYNPMYHMAVDKWYGPRNELKKLIDEAHKKGIAVVLDMVLNHAFGLNPMVRLYWDATNNRPAANSPWFNPIARHPYNVGYDFNHEAQATKDYVDRVNKFWIEEYKFDGFRFDLSKGFTQTNSGSNVGQWGQYDQSRINLLKRMAQQIWTVDPNSYVILEHFADNNEEIVLANEGMMLWGNHNSNYSEAAMGYHDNNKSNFGGVSWKNRNFSSPKLIGYMESHDEERLMFKNLQYGAASGNYSVKNLGTALARQKLAGAFFFTVPGPKMIWQFGELGYDLSIFYPCGNDGCKTDPKPVKWEYWQETSRVNLYKTYSELIKLKQNYPAFSSTDFTIDAGTAMKKIKINDASMNVTIVGNFGVTQASFNPGFQNTGKWYDFFSGDSITVSDVNMSVSLLPGEFKIYTTVKLPTPESGIATSIFEKDENEMPVDFNLDQNFPNPFNPSTTISFTIPNSGMVNLAVYNSIGELVKVLVNEQMAQGRYTTNFDATDLSSGIYFYRLVSEGTVLSKKMILLK